MPLAVAQELHYKMQMIRMSGERFLTNQQQFIKVLHCASVD